MLTPIEQTPPLAYEPARQQFIPVQPIEQPPPPSTIIQVQAAGNAPNSQDSSPGDGANSGGGESAADSFRQKAQAEAAQRLGAAWGYLQELKGQAAEALSNGDAHTAEQIASEAANVASDIRDIADVMAAPGGTVQSDLEEATTVSASSDPTFGAAGGASATPLGSAGGPETDIIDAARAGLSAAKDVIDLASQLPHYSVADRTNLDSYTSKVLDAMGGVETVAAFLAAANAGAQISASPANRLDISA